MLQHRCMGNEQQAGLMLWMDCSVFTLEVKKYLHHDAIRHPGV